MFLLAVFILYLKYFHAQASLKSKHKLLFIIVYIKISKCQRKELSHFASTLQSFSRLVGPVLPE